jgi:hypothetical protein
VTDVGVLTLAYGRPTFVEQAKSLARSIRHRSTDVSLAVATDFEPTAFDGLFDIVIPWRFDRWPGVASKLELHDITPFETTLFIDSDCLCIRSIEPVIDYFAGQDFAVYGGNLAEFSWGDRSGAQRAFVDAASYPSFNGGLYYFRRSPQAAEVFARAQHFFAHYDALGLRRPHGRMNDEPLISLAMASLGLRATDRPDLVVMVAPEPPAFAIDLDLLGGRCALVRRGEIVEPEIVHFAGVRSRIAAYRRERMVLELIVGGGWPRAVRPALALAAELGARTDRLGRVAARLRQRLG